MKTSNKFLSGTLALAIAVIATTSSAFAYQGDPSVKGPDHSPERHEAMVQAFETDDYEVWKGLMDGKGRVTQIINADNFARFADAHELAAEGKLEEAKAVRAELGLGLKDGSGRGQGKGLNRGNRSGLKDGSGSKK